MRPPRAPLAPFRLVIATVSLRLLTAWATPAAVGQTGCTPQSFGSATIDVPSIVVEPRFLLNGVPFPATGAAEVILVDASKDGFRGAQLSLGRTDHPPQPVRLVPGTYRARYAFRAGFGVPANAGAEGGGTIDARTDGPMVLRYLSTRLEVTKLHNGAPYAGPSVATLKLVGRRGEGEVLLGGMQPAPMQIDVLPGTYDVVYTWTSGSGLPRNRHAVLRQIVVGSSGPQRLVIDVPSLVQRVVFRHNGAPFPVSAYARGELVLTRGGDEEVSLGSSHHQAAVLRIVPGTFAVRWRRIAGSGAVPVNADGLAVANLALDGTPTTLDVRTVLVRGDLRVNGAVPPASVYDDGRLSLVTAAGDRAILGDTSDGTYGARVLAGTYDVAYERLAGGTVVPENTRTVIARAWNVAASPVRTLDIGAGTYLATVRLDGGAFPASVYEEGRIALLPLAGGDAVILGDTHDGTLSVRLVPGRYRAIYSRRAGAGIVPINVSTPFGREIVVQANGAAPLVPQLLDVPAGSLAVSYRHNGAPVAAGSLANGRLHLGRAGVSLARLGTLRDGSSTRVLIPGRYDVYYESLGGGTGLPANAFMRVGCWDLSE